MATFAIGDIHGRLDYLRELVDLRLPIKEEDDLVFIGDYVDRGPDSKGVIDFLMDLETRCQCIFLRGNHEVMFMAWLGLPIDEGVVTSEKDWIGQHGGTETLKSYGIPTGNPPFWRKKSELARRKERVPKAHAEFLMRTRLRYEDDWAYYVHAGINPKRPLDDQLPSDLLSIRKGWIDEEVQFDKLVVHGHTPTPYDGGDLTVRMTPYRINLDTGCGRHPNGLLSAVRLPDLALFGVGGKMVV
jgi:serine/threonine protein phosphatase 1